VWAREQSYVDAFTKDASALGAWIGPLRDVVAKDPSVLTDDRLRYGQIADAIQDWRLLDVALTLADELPPAPPAPFAEAQMWPVVAEVQDALVYPDGVIEAPIAIARPVSAVPVPAACRKKAKSVSDVVHDAVHGLHCAHVEAADKGLKTLLSADLAGLERQGASDVIRVMRGTNQTLQARVAADLEKLKNNHKDHKDHKHDKDRKGTQVPSLDGVDSVFGSNKVGVRTLQWRNGTRRLVLKGCAVPSDEYLTQVQLRFNETLCYYRFVPSIV
jgi:hypothetical protein